MRDSLYGTHFILGGLCEKVFKVVYKELFHLFMLDSMMPFIIVQWVYSAMFVVVHHGIVEESCISSSFPNQWTWDFYFERIFSCFLLSSILFINTASSWTSSLDLPSWISCCCTFAIHLFLLVWSFIMCQKSSLFHFLSFFSSSLSFS